MRLRLSWTGPKERYSCLLHDRGKPLHCQKFNCRSARKADEPECGRCGTCCKLSFGVLVEPERVEDASRALLHQKELLRTVGVDAGSAARYIETTGNVGPRRVVKAKKYTGLSQDHCFALVPESALKKGDE